MCGVMLVLEMLTCNPDLRDDSRIKCRSALAVNNKSPRNIDTYYRFYGRITIGAWLWNKTYTPTLNVLRSLYENKNCHQMNGRRG